MNFDTKASNIILVVFQMTLIFNKLFFQLTYVYLNEKPHPNIFYEITGMKLFIWNGNDIINSYSIYH